MVEEGFKECRDCHSEKPLDQFHKNPQSVDGHYNFCIACHRRRNRERYYRRLEGDHRDNRRTRPLTPQGHRLCPDCGERLRLLNRPAATEFAARKKAADGLHTYCKSCNNARSKASDERLHGSTRHRHLKRRYGVGADEVAEMIEEQGRVCKICLRKRAERRGPVRIAKRSDGQADHDHATGEVRGVLCFTCNVGLGNFADDPELMQRGINYLRGAAWPSILRESPGVYRLCS